MMTVRRLKRLLEENGMTVAFAESCTGGLISAKFVDLPGVSSVFKGGVVAYSNEVKSFVLGVDARLIRLNGAVSAEVAIGMAEGVSKITGANVALAVTGIAGPTGGTPEKPVGTVFIAWMVNGHVNVERFLFEGTRDEIRNRTVEKAFEILIDELEGSNGR